MALKMARNRAQKRPEMAHEKVHGRDTFPIFPLKNTRNPERILQPVSDVHDIFNRKWPTALKVD